MAVTEVRTCDVFGKASTAQAPVRTYRVSVFEVDEAGEARSVVQSTDIDLSPKGLKRLQKYLDHGITKPTNNRSKPYDDGGPFDQNGQPDPVTASA